MSRRSIGQKGIQYISGDPDEPYRRLASEVIFLALYEYRRAYATGHSSLQTHADFVLSDTAWHRMLRLDQDIYPQMLQQIREEEDGKRIKSL